MRTIQKTACALVMLVPVVVGLSNVPSLALAADAAKYGPSTQVTLKVDGMECRSCVKDIKRALQRVPGVESVEVDFKAGKAVVTYAPDHVLEEQLLAAVESASNAMYRYRATVIAKNEGGR